MKKFISDTRIHLLPMVEQIEFIASYAVDKPAVHFLEGLDFCTAKIINYLNEVSFSEKIVFIFVVDAIVEWTREQFIQALGTCVKRHPMQRFVVFDGSTLDIKYFNKHISEPNLLFLTFEPNVTDETYAQTVPVTKNFNSTKIGIMLNRSTKQHRLAVASYILGSDIRNQCLVTYQHLYKQLSKGSTTDFMEHCNWQFAENQYIQRDQMIAGFENLSSSLTDQNQEAYQVSPGTESIIKFSNAENFDKNLRQYYQNSFVEFISGTDLYPNGPFDEKLINVFFGQNFFINVGPAYQIHMIRSMGFDVFDDIVNHNYDIIENDIDRLTAAVDLNKQLFKDRDKTVDIWKSCQDRFQKNIEHFKSGNYNQYIQNNVYYFLNQHLSDVLNPLPVDEKYVDKTFIEKRMQVK